MPQYLDWPGVRPDRIDDEMNQYIRSCHCHRFSFWHEVLTVHGLHVSDEMKAWRISKQQVDYQDLLSSLPG